jgi:hypothetical protein
MTTPVATEVHSVETSEKPLTAWDRCDRCGAQAYMRTVHDGLDLLWCAHHAHEHREALATHVVVDDTHKLEN